MIRELLPAFRPQGGGGAIPPQARPRRRFPRWAFCLAQLANPHQMRVRMTMPTMPRRDSRGNNSNSAKKGEQVCAQVHIEAFANDNEPRISDEELARRLGYASLSAFRSLIRRHRKILNKINVLLRVSNENPDPVACERPCKAYYLTEAQAVFIIGKTGTPDADQVFAEIAKAFGEFRRRVFPSHLYGAIMRDILRPAPRTWQREYQESFWVELHKVGGWPRPAGNNHSNCAHFINEFIYSYLLGVLGLKALQDANPANDAGVRAHRHHQFLKEKHLYRLRQHIDTVEGLLSNSASIGHFADQFSRFFKVPRAQIGFLFPEEAA